MRQLGELISPLRKVEWRTGFEGFRAAESPLAKHRYLNELAICIFGHKHENYFSLWAFRLLGRPKPAEIRLFHQAKRE